jgi:cobyrinic acid a,c-diamide synthase
MRPLQPPPGLMIAAPRSGSGKTTVALGLMRALARAGVAVQPFKCGPDYIDPAFHAAAAGRPSFTLDSWAMDGARLSAALARASEAEIAVAEGSMGVLDGVATRGASGTGANADVAALTGWPALLVIDVSGQAQSAAAAAVGLTVLRPDMTLAGVILNRIASPRHEALTRAGFDAAGVPVLGALPRRDALVLPERHLGLVQAAETAALDARLEALADFVDAHLDVPGIASLAAALPAPCPAAPPPGQRIALAQDAAFSFVYPHLLADWRAQGAEILPFSPLADEAPDPSADAVWLPGGYPELHAGRLAAASRFRAGLRAANDRGPVHGECGGYMALGAGLIDADGGRHEMAGLLGLETSFAKRRMHLGYRIARLLGEAAGARAGALLRGHEFHYATVLTQPDRPLADVTDAAGAPCAETGSRRGWVTGTFFHLIAADAP